MFHVRTIMIHRVNGRELDKAISEASGHEFEMTHEYVMSDSDSMSLEQTIDPDEYEGAQKEWDEFVSTGEVGNPCTIIVAYLTVLCLEEQIQSGTYHIEW